MSPLLTWKRQALWPIYQPATRGRSRCFGFTFGRCHFIQLYIQSVSNPHFKNLKRFLFTSEERQRKCNICFLQPWSRYVQQNEDCWPPWPQQEWPVPPLNNNTLVNSMRTDWMKEPSSPTGSQLSLGKIAGPTQQAEMMVILFSLNNNQPKD